MNGLILFEDDHLLVVNKPSGINTHKPDPFAPDGIHEWLTKREARWRNLSILQRLDKDTSGVMVFGKTREANQSLSQQFEKHTVEKVYVLLSAARPTRVKFWEKSPNCVTEFEFIQAHGDYFLVQAKPVTGKTHQIRRHAANAGFPILGDTEYGGATAPRLMLHACRLSVTHPATGDRTTFEASVPRAFDEIDPLVAATEFRELLFDGEQTAAFRLVSGEADGWPDVVVDSYDDHLLVQWQSREASEKGNELIQRLQEECRPRAIYTQLTTKQERTPPQLASGTAMADRAVICENGVGFSIGFGEGLGAGIFLDQRENRRRLLRMPLTGRTVLNTFSYTCAFSVVAAKAGAVTASVDLSKNYLEWGRENFRLNGIDPAGHGFIFGDAFEWLKRFAKRGQRWDVVIVDPPTFSTTKKGRVFQAARDYEELAALAMPLVAPGGWLLCSTNQRTLAAEEFETSIRKAAKRCGRTMESLEFETVPFDFRLAPKERPYLKTFWAKLA
ncbi:MAG TPA: pseudouridine synthase [Verrucomicrobiae bacterium]|nr:pseudouridine synthase [Verrucomicrobiae bacterium]